MTRTIFFYLAVAIFSLTTVTFLVQWGNEPSRFSDSYHAYENLLAAKSNPLGIMLLLSVLSMGIWYSYEEIAKWVIWSSGVTLAMSFGILYAETSAVSSTNVLIDVMTAAGGATFMWLLFAFLFTIIVLVATWALRFVCSLFGLRPQEQYID